MIAAENPKLIALKEHDDPAVEAQLSIARKAAGPPPLDPRVEKLQPIDPKQIKSPADDAVAELTWQNPMQPYATLPAALAVTAVTKTGRLAEGAHAPSLRRIVKFTRPLPQPRFACGDAELKPLEIGSATHLVMQVIDLSTPPTRPAVDAAIGALVDRKFISAEQAAVVDREAVVWFLGTPLGTMLRDRRQFVLRELPVFAPAASDPSLPKSDDPRDRVMLRGQIDALLRTDEGLIVIDYKTDRVTPQTLPQRVEFYREQIRAYADVIGRVAGLPVVSSHLAFMHVRRIVPV